MASRILEQIAKRALTEIGRLAASNPKNAVAVLEAIWKFVKTFRAADKEAPSREALEEALKSLKDSIADNDSRADAALRRRKDPA